MGIMNVLVVTNELQGTRPGDFAWTVEGELVTVELAECATPSTCGCGRGFVGLASGRATTTAMVVDLPHVSADDLRDVVRDWLDRAGWSDLLDERGAAHELDEIIDEHVENTTLVCSNYAIGTVVERSGSIVAPRGFTAAA